MTAPSDAQGLIARGRYVHDNAPEHLRGEGNIVLIGDLADALSAAESARSAALADAAVLREALEELAETGGWVTTYVKDEAYPDEPACPSLSNDTREIARAALSRTAYEPRGESARAAMESMRAGTAPAEQETP